MTQSTGEMPDYPDATEYLQSLVGKQVTIRFKSTPNHGSWGPYDLLAVYPDGVLPSLLVRGSRDYLIPLDGIGVIHEGAKPKKVPSWQQEQPSGIPGMPGISLEDDEDDED